MVTDPVCGMEIPKEDSPVQTTHGDQTYYFCTPECLEIFVKDPEKYK